MGQIMRKSLGIALFVVSTGALTGVGIKEADLIKSRVEFRRAKDRIEQREIKIWVPDRVLRNGALV